MESFDSKAPPIQATELNHGCIDSMKFLAFLKANLPAATNLAHLQLLSSRRPADWAVRAKTRKAKLSAEGMKTKSPGTPVNRIMLCTEH
ncbi:hypothetical protein PIB30_098885 [Stylosanthes scabra]|uniref:Uncharacterized protein n=1 Tax=Stylosanthes scabra TaxID=79078 RepID=A0ABU6ZVF2_9FABA|nr:hypothetical protein [Stylosanthes scabra]